MNHDAPTVDHVRALATQAHAPEPLSQGLARNTMFNVLGWAWPVALAFLSLPYIVNGLATEAYGLFGLVSIVAGYLGLLNAPMAFGNVRFMAEAYGKQDWRELHKYVISGLWVDFALVLHCASHSLWDGQ